MLWWGTLREVHLWELEQRCKEEWAKQFSTMRRWCRVETFLRQVIAAKGGSTSCRIMGCVLFLNTLLQRFSCNDAAKHITVMSTIWVCAHLIGRLCKDQNIHYYYYYVLTQNLIIGRGCRIFLNASQLTKETNDLLLKTRYIADLILVSEDTTCVLIRPIISHGVALQMNFFCSWV